MKKRIQQFINCPNFAPTAVAFISGVAIIFLSLCFYRVGEASVQDNPQYQVKVPVNQTMVYHVQVPPTVIDYTVAQGASEVRSYIQRGWTPIGGVSFYDNTEQQAMVLLAPSKLNEEKTK